MILHQIEELYMSHLRVLCLALPLLLPITTFADVPLKHSKEYQIVLKNEAFVDIEQGKQTIIDWLQSIEDDPDYDFKYKSGTGNTFIRNVVRYDTSTGELSTSNLNLKIEQFDDNGANTSKLKLKYSSMDPDASFDTTDYTRSFPYPANDYEDISKMKFELDMHQNYSKFALSGSMEIAGVISYNTVGDAEHYFKRLDHVIGVSNSDALVHLDSYQEWVFDDIELKIADYPAEAAVVVRYALSDLTQPIRVEFSLKMKRDGSTWDYFAVVELGQVYAEMLNNDLNVWKGLVKPNKFIIPADQD